MGNEPKKIFREKTLEKVNSPEQLNSYVHTVNAGVWIVLLAVITVIVGAIVWCVTFSLEIDTVKCAAVTKNGNVKLYFVADDRNKVAEGMTVHIGESDYVLPDVEVNGVKLYQSTDSKIMNLIGADGEEYAYFIGFSADIPNGIYEATVVSEEISPLELLFN